MSGVDAILRHVNDHLHATVRIGFVDFGYARGHRGKVPIENWALNRIGLLNVETDPHFTAFAVVDEWEDEIRPREDPSALDIDLQNWALDFDIIVSWNGLFGDYLPLARLSDEVAGILPLSVDLQRQLALDVEDVFPAKSAWPGIGLDLERVYDSFGDEYGLGRKYRGDPAIEDCYRMFSIYRKMLNGEPMNYEHVVRRGPVNIIDDRAVIPPSLRTLAAMHSDEAAANNVRCDVDWADVTLPSNVVALLDDRESWSHKPVLRFALQLLSPSVNERVRAQLRDGMPLEAADLARLRVALDHTP